MTATVLPFPLARRRGLIRRQAWRYLDLTANGAENNLRHQLQLQGDALLRKGVEPDAVEVEIAGLERAIRAEIIRLSYAPRDVGA